MKQKETMRVIADALKEIPKRHGAECRLCGCFIMGRSFGEVLERLGQHGEREHGM